MAADTPLPQLSSATVAEIIGLCGELDTPFALTVCGQSMAPMLRDGDKVLLHALRRPLRRGDIIVRQCGEGILMHRVVGLRRVDGELWVMTKGDNSLAFDEPVLASEILGLVVEVLAPSGLDLRRGPWPMLSRLLAGYSALHGRCWRAARRLGGKLPSGMRRGLGWITHLLLRCPVSLAVACGRVAVRLSQARWWRSV